MQKTINKWMVSTSIVALVVLLGIVYSSPSRAEELKVNQNENQVTLDNSYRFKTPKKANLTLLVRKAILLYDQENEAIELSKSAIIFAETNIVKTMGAKQLDVNQEVTIDKVLVEEFVKKATELSPEKIIAWDAYTKGVDFELKDINIITATSSTNTDEKGQNPATTESTDQASKTNPDENEEKSSTFYWVLVAIATVAIVYYISGNSKTSTSRRSKE